MHLSHLVILTGVLGAAAHPSGHAHLHRAVHERRPPPVFVKNIHHQSIPNPKSKPAPEPVATTSAAPAPAATIASVSASTAAEPAADANAKFIPFCSGGGAASRKEKRVTVEQVMYAGNLGMANGCPWNSNIIEIPNSIADLYDYTQVYKNVDKVSYEVRCANKLGANKELTGMFEVPGQNHLVFSLAPGETKTIAVQGDSQIICAFAPGSVPKTPFGQYAGNWVESDYGNASNGAWSGADCSSLVAQHYDMHVPGCRVCEGGVCSTILEGGHGDNAYTKGMEELDGIGLNIVPGKVKMIVDVGYH
ncbi:hypothetical protein OQA88_1781 [Cercophora sp. LCS_1]